MSPSRNSLSRIIPFAVLFFFVLLIKASPILAATGNEMIVPDQPEYMEGETAYIYGSGFTPNVQVIVQVIRVDGSIVTGNGTETPGSDMITADPYGSFIYPYWLSGGTSEQYYGTLTVYGVSYNKDYSYNGSTDVGYNIYSPTSEMAYMYYVELSNIGYCDTTANCPQTYWGLSNTVPFDNLQSWYYWSGTEYNNLIIRGSLSFTTVNSAMSTRTTICTPGLSGQCRNLEHGCFSAQV